MMNINKTISKNIFKYLADYISDDNIKTKIVNFLTSHEKRNESIKIIEEILKHHQKGEFINQLEEMRKVEYGIRELQPLLRDHVTHALNTFILGIYLNNKFYKLDINPFQWKISSLLHDIAYPIELAFKYLINPFIEKICKNNDKISVFDIMFYNLHNCRNGLHLINDCLKKWQLEIDVIEEYHTGLNNRKICHGMLSSLSVLYFIDELYEKNHSWDRKSFNNDVIPACAAIFVHNLSTKYFIENKLIIDSSIASLAFLLKLSDCLQEWERPSKENPKGFSSCQFDIKKSKESLLYYAELPEDKIKKIEKDLEPLQGSNIKIKMV